MSDGQWVALVPLPAVEHLAETVLHQLALAELETGSPEEVHWPMVRDAALRQLQAEAALGHERAGKTWAALVTAGYDAEFCQLVNGLEADAGGEDRGDG